MGVDGGLTPCCDAGCYRLHNCTPTIMGRYSLGEISTSILYDEDATDVNCGGGDVESCRVPKLLELTPAIVESSAAGPPTRPLEEHVAAAPNRSRPRPMCPPSRRLCTSGCTTNRPQTRRRGRRKRGTGSHALPTSNAAHRLGRAPITINDAPLILGGEAGLRLGRNRHGLRLACILPTVSKEAICTVAAYTVNNATRARAAPSRASLTQ